MSSVRIRHPALLRSSSRPRARVADRGQDGDPGRGGARKASPARRWGMFTQGTYVDDTGTLRDAGGADTGFAVEDDGRIISTDGANDTGGAFIDGTGQVFYGDSTPMQGVTVTIGG